MTGMEPGQGGRLNRFTESLRSSVAHGDWYVALATALTLPDVCGRLIEPDAKSGPRYKAWFRDWMEQRYTIRMDDEVKVFLTGDDCYALRCSYLHEGGGGIAHQTARKALDNFRFIFPPKNGWRMHLNLLDDNTLQLQVDVFCLEIADAVEQWCRSVSDNDDIQGRMGSLLTIYDIFDPL